MFLVKKTISLFLMPFPIFILLIGIGLYFWQRGHPLRAKKIIIFALLWISLLSYPPFSALLLYPLESSYQKVHFTQTVPHYIHVLGCGHTSNDNIPLSSQLDLVSLARVNEGVSIYKSYPNMKIIFSGYGGQDPVSDARKNSQMAIALGVKPEDIILLESPKDTYEEALQAQMIIGGRQLILVTSASHMPRAAALFKKAGISIIAAPTDFQIKGSDALLQFPSSYGLKRSEAAFHEYLGIGWNKIIGLL
jgi:uncharacterized SAM-binding protein YcdF (DUF218 family)